MNSFERTRRWILSTLGIHYYSYYYHGRAFYVGKPGRWVLKDVKPLEGAADQRPLADIPRVIPR